MKCDSCNDNVATVHLTEIVNKTKNELHLCEECARSKGVSVQHAFAPTAPSVSLLANPPAVTQTKLVLKTDELAGLTCPVCGMTFSDFKRTGRLGCANDYIAFKKGLTPLLERIHGQADHHGKMPTDVIERLEKRREVTRLREELNRAIQAEAYERAAELRDQIYQLEEQRT